MSSCHLENTPHGVSRSGSKIHTRVHAEYITRQGKYAHMGHREEDLVYTTSGNIPEWADNDMAFWEAAETHRRKNGRAYREIRLGLQEELSLEENIACVEEFISQLGIKDHHVYTYAIHDKVAMFDDEHRNIHAHIMFNEKRVDYAKTDSPEAFFSRYSTDADGNSTKGLPVDRWWNEKASTIHMRNAWEEIVNQAFERNHREERISMQTLEAQRKLLIAEGRFEEAELLNRKPSEHLGNVAKNPKNRERIKEMIDEIEAGHDVFVKEHHATSDGDSSGHTTSEDFSKQPMDKPSEWELQMMVFAHDAVIRKLAKEIQKERKELLKKQAAMDVAEKDKKSANPTSLEDVRLANIVTVGDIVVGLEERMISSLQKQEELANVYRLKERDLLLETTMHRSICDALTDGLYGEQRAQVQDKTKLYKWCQRDLDKGLSNVCSYQEFVALRKRKEQSYQSRKEAVKKLLATRQLAHKSKEFEQVKASTLEEQRTLRTELAMLQASMAKEYKNYSLYSRKAEDLLDARVDAVLFTDAIPREVRKFDKLYGEKSLSELPMIAKTYTDAQGKMHMDQYIVIDGSVLDKQERNQTVHAIKLRDTVTKGKAPVYDVQVIPTVSQDGREYFTAGKVQKTERSVELYQYRQYKKKDVQDAFHTIQHKKQKQQQEYTKRTPRSASKPKPSQPSMPKPIYRTGGSGITYASRNFIASAMDHIVSAKDYVGKRQGLWHEEDERYERKSDMQRAEEMMKGSWSL